MRAPGAGQVIDQPLGRLGLIVAADLVELLPASYARILQFPMIRQAFKRLFTSVVSSNMASLRHANFSFVMMS